MNVETFIILSVLTAGAAMIQGASGMGFALILAPVFGLMRPDFLPVTLLILMLPLNVMVFWNERAAIDWRGARWITFGRFWGTFGGLWVLSVLTPGQLGVAVGWLTIAAAVGALAAPRRADQRRAAAIFRPCLRDREWYRVDRPGAGAGSG